MNSKPLVSIIIPCYNVSEFVEKSVGSILKQSYKNLEIFLIDDASTDDTLRIIKGIKDHRIKLIEVKENTQKVGAVNKALQLALGDLIAFQDADDWSEPDRIENQVVKFMESKNLGICFTNYSYRGKEIVVPDRVAISDEELKDEFLKFGSKQFKPLSPTMCATMMISRAVLEETNGYHPYFAGKVAEDIHWVYRILKNHNGFTINRPLYNINIRKGSLTQEQLAGNNTKAAYTWQLLSKIIAEDINNNVDVLDSANIHKLHKLELEACEEALVTSIRNRLNLKRIYETSASYRLGSFILHPLKVLKGRSII